MRVPLLSELLPGMAKKIFHAHVVVAQAVYRMTFFRFFLTSFDQNFSDQHTLALLGLGDQFLLPADEHDHHVTGAETGELQLEPVNDGALQARSHAHNVPAGKLTQMESSCPICIIKKMGNA